jgi:hypothetical protein
MVRCAFCRNVADSREHLWSDWMDGILPPSTEHEFHRMGPDGTIKTFNLTGLDAMARVVCSVCNSGWMSEVEGSLAKPALTPMILSHDRVDLGVEQIVSTAAFTFMKAVVANHADRNLTPFFSDQERRMFRTDLRIPKGVWMWVASLAGDKARRGAFTGYCVDTKPATHPSMNFYVFNFNVGHVVLQLLAAKFTSREIRRVSGNSISMRQNPACDKKSIPSWPSSGKPIVWPPPELLDATGDSFNTFLHRWYDFDINNFRGIGDLGTPPRIVKSQFRRHG